MPVYKTSKEEIIKKSFLVFLEKGYYHTTILDLSKVCGIEKPHFYYYFKNKQDLMISVLKFITLWASKNMFIHAYNSDLTPKVRLKKMLNVLKSIHLRGYAGCIFSNTALETANNENDFLPTLQNYFNTWQKALETIYNCKYNKKESRKRAIRFFSELNGSILLMKVYKDHSYIDQFIKIQLEEL